MSCLGIRRWKHRRIIFLIFVALFVIGSMCCSRSKSFKRYDGTWWANTPLDQKLGFIDGFVDGYTYGCREAKQLCTARNELETAISSYYTKHGEDDSMLVGDVLLRTAGSSGAFANNEETPQKSVQENDAFDGFVWLKYSPKKRLGFVEGYLNALMPQTSRSVFFPKNPEHYSSAVTGFYSVPSAKQSQTGTNEDPLKRPIAKVLWGMKNQRK